MTQAEEIFKKHWKLKTGKELDEVTRHNMQYCIDAINEALTLKNKEQQAEAIREIMRGDEELGLYNKK